MILSIYIKLARDKMIFRKSEKVQDTEVKIDYIIIVQGTEIIVWNKGYSR